MSADIIELSSTNFKESIKSGLILVDFWATWCPPCVKMSPELEIVAKKIGDKVKIAKLNTEQAEELSAEYSISNIPCLVLFRDGVEIHRMVGFRNAATLEKELEDIIKT